MAETKYQRDTQRFECTGLDLNRPVDSVKPTKFPYLKNVRSFLAGRIEPRDGITDITTGAVQIVSGQTPVHSCRRLNDSANNTFKRIVGTGTHLASGQTTFTDLGGGYSGNPLSLVPFRPYQSPIPYMYVADSLKARKVNSQNVVDSCGYAAPTTEPPVTLSTVPKYKVIDDGFSTTGWSTGGSASGLVLASTVTGLRTNCLISQIIYDVGTTGWATIFPSNATGIAAGERLIVNSGGGNQETTVVQSIRPGSGLTTIANIIYDSGNTGPASVYFTTAVDLTGNMDGLVSNNTVVNLTRIIGIATGPDGTTSIRVNTLFTWNVGDSINLVPSFRCYLVNTHVSGGTETLTADALRFTAGGNSGGQTNFITKTFAVDLSQIATGVPTQKDDLIYISLWMDSPQSVAELKIMLDVDATTNDFTHNFYYKSFRPSDLSLAVNGIQTTLAARSTAVQNNVITTPIQVPATSQGGSGSTIGAVTAAASILIKIAQQAAGHPQGQSGLIIQNYQSNSGGILSAIGGALGTVLTGGLFGAGGILGASTTSPIDNNFVSQQLESGTQVYVPVAIRISDLIRVGTDDSRSLANVAAIRIYALCTSTNHIQVDSWFLGGGYGPNSFDATAIPYLYRYRVRNPNTGVRSNPSPASRYTVEPLRQSVTITPPQYTNLPADVTVAATSLVLDIERFGGFLAEWHYVGTVNNTASPSFTDTQRDDIIAGNPLGTISDYQPWPIIGVPVQGTTGQIAGTSVLDSGTNFNTSWAPGTRIIINGLTYTIYRVNSTSFMEIVENADSQNAVSWRIDEPTLLNQPLQTLWYQDNYNTFFACGDPINPGRLYWTNPNSETTTPANYIDVTNPSEQLVNGVAYNTRSYAFSSENMYQILTTSSLQALAENSNLADAPVGYEAQRINGGKGLYSTWAITREVSPVICFLAKDGIQMTTGGAPIPLTDADLYELFPNEGNLGVVVNGINPPNIIASQIANLRLTYYDEYLYFDYVDTAGNHATLLLSFDVGAAVRGEAPGGWFWDIYGNSGFGVQPSIGVFHYGEEGQNVQSLLIGDINGHLSQYSPISLTDNGTAVSMEFTTPSRDQGEPRVNKLYGDVMLDSNTGGTTTTITPFLNNNTVALAPFSLTSVPRSLTTIPLGTGWQTARNISLNFVTLIGFTIRPFFFIWEPRWTFESAPIAALSWEISPTTYGMRGFSHYGLCHFTHVSTVDLALIFTVDNIVQPAVTIPNSGGVYATTIFRVPPMKGKLQKVRVASSDNITNFRLDTRDTYLEVKDWGEDDQYQKLRVFGDFSIVEG